AGTPYAACARASVCSLSRQNFTPPATRSCERKDGAYSNHFGGSSNGRSMSATIFGWNLAAANQRSTSARGKPVSAATSAAYARTSGRAAYPVAAAALCFALGLAGVAGSAACATAPKASSRSEAKASTDTPDSGVSEWYHRAAALRRQH